MFQNIWADHADYISIQYSGTGALKTDYTRTGRRTYLGALRDGANSLLRYYKNNLKDGFRQVIIEGPLFEVVDSSNYMREIFFKCCRIPLIYY